MRFLPGKIKIRDRKKNMFAAATTCLRQATGPNVILCDAHEAEGAPLVALKVSSLLL